MKKIKNSLLLLLVIILLPAVIYAVFFDKETSITNILQAETLDIQFIPETDTITLTPQSSVTVNARIINIGTLPNNNTQTFLYKISGPDFTSNIDLVVSGDISYSGKLSNYKVFEIPLAYGETKTISYTFSISEESYLLFNGESVTFKISDLATQLGFTYPNGFHDTEVMTLTISLPEIPQPEASTEAFQEESNLIPQINEETL